MKKRFFLIGLITVTFALFLANAYAHSPGHYGKDDIETEVKKIDKGIQLTITSEDPEIAKEIQEDSRYYKDILAHRDRCPHMERMAQSHHSCMW